MSLVIIMNLKLILGSRFEDCRGRYLVAEKKIQRGEIVAVESPIVAFPILHEWQVHFETNIDIFYTGNFSSLELL